MFGSWKSRSSSDKTEDTIVVVQDEAWDDDDDEAVFSEIEEELSAFINRQLAWQGLAKSKRLPSWMKTTSLNRCSRTPPLPPKKTPPTPPPRRRSRSRQRDFGGSLSSTNWTPTPPLRRTVRSRSASLQSISVSSSPWIETRHMLRVS